MSRDENFTGVADAPGRFPVDPDGRLKISLKQKDLLLAELHHRVRNNLQLISSLINLQSEAIGNAPVRRGFDDLRDRIRCMALLHEQLYHSDTIGRLDFATYARRLLHSIWGCYGALAGDVRLNLDVAPVSLSTEAAEACGLIINELATNSLKHAFQGRAGGQVTVSLHRAHDGRAYLRVGDDGVGLPAGLDWRRSDLLGLRLVRLLAGQLNATVDMKSSAMGTEFRIVF